MVVIPNRVRVVVVVSALALAAGLLTLALLAKPTQAQAETTTTNERVPLNETVFNNPCTDEGIHIEGTVHMVQHVTIDENGGSHTEFHHSTRGKGESLTTGAEYVILSLFTGHNNVSGDSADNLYFTQIVKFIRQGSTTPEDDLEFKWLLHITRNANGERTAEVVRGFESTCQ
jgi:hypothetical protein